MTAESGPPPLQLAGGSELEVRETHISWVLLAGDRAYKVKKPIVLPFLDYGSPARRRAMCHAEVELNRRLAPDVYLGVRSLVRAPDGRLRLGAEDDRAAIDYAVVMRRFRDDATLDARLAAGTAGSADVTALGERLARFHAEATTHVTENGAESAKRALDDTFASLRSLVEAGDAQGCIVRGERFTSAFLTAVWDELDRRARSGRVRDGHGDLRLEHVLLERSVEIVDCVEFDPSLRRIDVAADLAFLVMELHERGRPQLAAALVAAYRAAGGDPGSDALLAFFASYRAHVRAKVRLLRARQVPPGHQAARGEVAHAAALLSLGERLQWSARTPMAIVVAGLSGTGKSTLAGALARRSGFLHLNSDVIRKQRAGLQPTDTAPLELYGPETDRDTYAELGHRTAAAAATGVLVDATFRRRADRDTFRSCLPRAIPLLLVECQAPAPVLEARARSRASDPTAVSDAGVDVVRRQAHDADPLDEVPSAYHLHLRSDRPPAQLADEVGDALDQRLIRNLHACRVADHD